MFVQEEANIFPYRERVEEGAVLENQANVQALPLPSTVRQEALTAAALHPDLPLVGRQQARDETQDLRVSPERPRQAPSHPAEYFAGLAVFSEEG